MSTSMRNGSVALLPVPVEGRLGLAAGVAEAALVRHHAVFSHLVSAQLTGLGKTPLANVACERFLAGVNAHVTLHVELAGHEFGTHRTRLVVALIAQVDRALVALQRLFALKGAAARLTRPCHRAKIMHPHVRLDEAAANEVGAAQRALEAP